MKVEFLGVKGKWKDILNACRTTINRQHIIKEPDSDWKRKLLLSEHSPIRQLIIKAKWVSIKYWVSVHLVRHKFGIEHWIGTQRTDRTGVNRDLVEQGNEVDHEVEANAQAIITISRKRLCQGASKETREAWQKFLLSFKDDEPELYYACVPDCIYRGHCFEINSCNFHKSPLFKKELEEYRKGIN